MKGYIIGRANIVDQQKSENYKPLVAAANKKFGGKYLARVKVYNKRGNWIWEKCYNWVSIVWKSESSYESDEYKKALGVLGDGMERTLVIVEGEEETK